MYAEWPKPFLIYFKKLPAASAYETRYDEKILRTVVNFIGVPVVYARRSGTSGVRFTFSRRCYLPERKCF